MNILISIAALIGAIVAPTLYIGDIKEVNAVQNVKITAVEQTQAEIKSDIKEIRKGMDALLLRNGISVDKK